MTLLTSRGQAFVETLLSLPVLALGVTLVLGGLHSLFAFYITDYWSYQSVLYMNKENPIQTCQSSLEQNMKKIPYLNFEINEFRRTSYESRVSVEISTVFLNSKIFIEKIPRQLGSNDFRGRL